MNSSSVCIEVQGLTKTYSFGKIKALDGVDITIHKGELFALIGANGAGKTTFMGCCLGLLQPQQGQIKIFDKSPNDLATKQIIGFLPERPQFESWMTARQFLVYHYSLAKMPRQNLKSNINEAFDQVALPEKFRDQSVRTYSRGMLQRLGLAQVLIGKPSLCFLDEPASGMDPLGIDLVRNLLSHWRKQGTTVILNSHHLDEVEKSCDRFAFMKAGKIDRLESIGAQDNTVIVIRWSQTNGTAINFEKLALLANTDESKVLEISESWARISITNPNAISTLLRQLILSDIPIEEAIIEKRSLVDLFYNANDPHYSMDMIKR